MGTYSRLVVMAYQGAEVQCEPDGGLSPSLGDSGNGIQLGSPVQGANRAVEQHITPCIELGIVLCKHRTGEAADSIA